MRRHERQAVKIGGRLAYVDQRGERKEGIIKVLDLSARGAKCTIEDVLPVGAYVVLIINNSKIRGNASVRYCRRHQHLWVVGLEFVGFQISAEQMAPFRAAQT